MDVSPLDNRDLRARRFQFSLRRMLISVAVAAAALGGMLTWQGKYGLIPGLIVALGLGGIALLGGSLRSPRALVNIGWSVVGLVCGASVGFWHAMRTVGSDPNRLPSALHEAIATRALVAAMVGTLIGWLIGLACERRSPSAETERTRIPWFVWMLLLLGALLVLAHAPPECPME